LFRILYHFINEACVLVEIFIFYRDAQDVVDGAAVEKVVVATFSINNFNKKKFSDQTVTDYLYKVCKVHIGSYVCIIYR